jgi:hypothetical protein
MPDKIERHLGVDVPIGVYWVTRPSSSHRLLLLLHCAVLAADQLHCVKDGGWCQAFSELEFLLVQVLEDDLKKSGS